MKTNATWLNNRFVIPQKELKITMIQIHMNCDEPSTSNAKNLKLFSQLGYRQKKHIEILRINNTPEDF